MPEYKKNPRFNDARRPFSRGPQNRSFDRKELFEAECSNCHRMTQVPFRPNGKKPVYCKDCFTPEANRDQKPRFESRSFGPSARPAPAAPRAEDSRIGDMMRTLAAMNATLEKLSAAVEDLSRREALTAVMRPHVAAESAVKAPRKVTKKAASKEAASPKP